MDPMRRRLEQRGVFLLIALVGLAPLLACGMRPSSAADAEEPATQETARASEPHPPLLARVFAPRTEEVTAPAGTLVAVKFGQTLSSHDSAVGEGFVTRVQQEVSVGGRVVIPSGARIFGSVSEARGPKKVGGRARLSLDFHTLELPSGEKYPIAARFAGSGKSQTPKDAAVIGGSTLGGAILGEAIDEGEGTIVGAIVGGLAGTAAAIKTRGKPVTVPAGTVMSLELARPVTVEVRAG